MKYIVNYTLCEPRNICILVCHWLFHAYGIISLTRLENPSLHGSLLALVSLCEVACAVYL